MSLLDFGEIVGCGVVEVNHDISKNHSNLYELWVIHSKYVEDKKTLLKNKTLQPI